MQRWTESLALILSVAYLGQRFLSTFLYTDYTDFMEKSVRFRVQESGQLSQSF